MQPLEPHRYWQRIEPAGTDAAPPAGGFRDTYPARFADGRVLALPIRVLPGDGTRAVASLIVNQASFAVLDALADAMARLADAAAPEVVIGVPTLGLPLAEGVARRLGHGRMVALGTSRKFWYDEGLAEPIASITSPDAAKKIYLDPRMLPLLSGRRVLVVDDVVSSGRSMGAVLRLLAKADVRPAGIVAAMLQTDRWRDALAPLIDAGVEVHGVLATPFLLRTPEGGFLPER